MRRMVVAVFLVFSGHALAWDSFGHMLVADVAYAKLTPAAQSKIAVLLKKNPQYSTWTKGVASKDQARVAFLQAATWPDAIKNMSGYTNDAVTNAKASQNIGYSDKLEHRYWHFIDTPFSPDGTPTVAPPVPNAQTQIAAFRKVLGSSASATIQSYDLVWLLHLVGDIHQPLHATSRFDKDQPKGDNGGNSVALCAKPCTDELHGFWDDVLGTSTSVADVDKEMTKLPAADATKAAISDEAKWVQESFQLAESDVYKMPVGVGAGPFTLDAAYKSNAASIAQKQIALAGARLANLLNAAFP